MKAARLEHAQFGDFRAKVKLRIERMRLLHQPVDEFLRTADRKRRNVIDRLVRIELGALPARRLERIDHMGRNAEQPELEDLKQAARPRADDDDFRIDRVQTKLPVDEAKF